MKPRRAVPAFAELDCLTHYSFLEGAAYPHELALEAHRLGMAALGVADRNSLAGVVRAWQAGKDAGLTVLTGCRLQFTDGAQLIVYPRDRAAYGRLCRLLSIGKAGIGGDTREVGTREAGAAPIPKNACELAFDQAAELGHGLIALAPAPAVIDAAFEARLRAWREAWPGPLYLIVAPLYRGDDRARLNALAGLAARTGAPMVASNAVIYHAPERRRLQDVLTCVRHGVTIDAAGLKLEANAEHHLKSPEEMARLFAGHEDAIARTLKIVQACAFRLDDLKYQYPDEPIPPGKTASQHLRDLTLAGARKIYPSGVPTQIVQTLRKELKLIRKLRYEHYFLTVHDIVAWARSREPPILCQGRGSAANSVVCFCLGITSVDPAKQDVLFERFISQERSEPPDIDVDFEHERREEVIQYIYGRYGRHRAAICATQICYRPRSAIRDVGKALGLTEDVTSALANTVWGSWGPGLDDDHVDRTGLDQESPRLKLALELTRPLIGFPRHLSQHVGGFVLTQAPLIETVPVGNGAMPDRTFIEWDKDDIDALNIMKVDVLALGMLTAIRKGLDLIARHHGHRFTLATVPRECPEVYDMLCKADSVGVFQVESRAQMAMLPRLLPREFYDLVVEVAIVRPGPIQGGMVHPYLKARKEQREAQARGEAFVIDFPRPGPRHDPDELKKVLGKTLGVPLFQEQVMRIAMVAAEFTGEEANGLRRAMATFRHMGTIHTYEAMMVERMVGRGYQRDFAEACFNQIKGFGEYGFPESHAAAFAQLVYVSAWIKCFYPAAFCAALLNSQPMGFYAPAQLVRDAREHGVVVLPPDVGASDWDCTLEGTQPFALRLGLRQIDGLRQEWAEKIMTARAERAFADIDDLRRRAGLTAAALDALAAADALGALNLSRREGLWAAKGLPRALPAPLFAAAGLNEADGAPPSLLPRPSASQDVVNDYETLRLSLKGHPISFLRERLTALGAVPAGVYERLPDGRRVSVAGVVLVRQRPGEGNAIFLTLEDETGVANVVLWPRIFEAFRPQVMGARLLLVRGKVQRADGVVHLMGETLEDLSADLALLSEPAPRGAAFRPSVDGAKGSPDPRGRGEHRRHPRNVRVLPKSRDFH